MSDDERRSRRRASERAVDPVSRTLLATAEGHQEYIDDMTPGVEWRDWTYNWVFGALNLVLGGVVLAFFLAWWFPLALPLGLILLVVGVIVLLYPWMRRPQEPAESQHKSS